MSVCKKSRLSKNPKVTSNNGLVGGGRGWGQKGSEVTRQKTASFLYGGREEDNLIVAS
jgi:hypothetical protein